MRTTGSICDNGVTAPHRVVALRRVCRVSRQGLCLVQDVMGMLSPRQREILSLVAAGRTSKEIAGELGISESTVNWHLANAFERLGASSRAEAVALAIRDEADSDDHKVVSQRRPGRPPLPPLSLAIVLALTLLLGVIGGAFMAGWSLDWPAPTPAPSVTPTSGSLRSVEPSVGPQGVGTRRTEETEADEAVAVTVPPSSPPPTPLPLEVRAPTLGTIVPALPSLAVPALPTLPPAPSVAPRVPALP